MRWRRMGEEASVPPAIGSSERLMIPTRLVMAERAKLGEQVDLGEGYRLAAALRADARPA